MKKILLLGFLMVLLSSFVSAYDLANNVLWISMDDADYGGGTYTDLSGYKDMTESGVISSEIGLIEQARNYTTGQYISSAHDSIYNARPDITACFWEIHNNIPTPYYVFNKQKDSSQWNGWSLHITAADSVVFEMSKGGSGSSAVDPGTLSLYTWNHICGAYDGAILMLYVNGVNVDNTSYVQTEDTTSIALSIGNRQAGGYGDIANTIDEVSFWNVTLTTEDIQTLYASGVGVNPYTAIPPNVSNESIENTVLFKQVGEVLVSGAGFTTIMNNTFEVFNSTDTYFGYSSTILANNDNVAECRFLVDGLLQESSFNRSNSGGVHGNMHILGNHTNLGVGNHSSSFQCRKIGGVGNFRISETVGIGHLLIDEFGDNLTHNFMDTHNLFFNSPSSFVLINSTLMNMSNKTNTSEIERVLYANWGANLIHNATNNITTLISIDGVNCSEYPRFAPNGGLSSTGGNCLQRGFSPNQTINISIFGKGVGTVSHFHLHTTEFFVESREINGTFINGVNITSATLFNLVNLSIENEDHVGVNIVVKAGMPLVSNSGNTTDSFQFRLSGDTILNGTVFTKDVLDTPTILIPQDIFEDVGIGNFTVELWGACDNANCSIVGGEMDVYIADLTTSISQAFNLSVFDIFDDSNILDFTATTSDGTQFISTVGFALVTSQLLLDNITVSSNFSGGYFDNTTFNHNVSYDLNVNLSQTLISWNCTEKVSTADLSCTSPTETQIFNYNVLGNPHTQSINVTGYFETFQVFNVAALQNETLTATGFYSTNLSINSSSTIGIVNNCSYTVSSLNHSFSEIVEGSPLASVGLINGSYNVLAACDGFANDTLTVVISATYQNLSFELYTVNSMLFTFYNQSDLSLLNTTTISIDLHGASVDYSFSTSNGSLFIDGLNSDTYQITFTSPVTNPAVLYGTLTGGEFLNFDVYLSGVLVSKDFIVKDTLANFLGDVILTFIQTINGSDITIGQTTTDFSGRASIYLDPSIDYNFFAVKDGFDVFTGSVTPSQSEYNIIMTQIGLERFVSAFEDVIYYAGLDYISGNNYATPYLIINSINGSLQYYGFNTTYNSVSYLANNTGTPGGGIEELNITPIVDSQRFVTVTYFFKATGYDVITWDVPFYLINLTPTNMTFADGLFDDITDLPDNDPIKLGIGMFIIILFVLIFRYGSSADFSAMVVGAMLGLGICYTFGLFPDKLLSVSMITLGIVLIADNVGGRR